MRRVLWTLAAVAVAFVGLLILASLGGRAPEGGDVALQAPPDRFVELVVEREEDKKADGTRANGEEANADQDDDVGYIDARRSYNTRPRSSVRPSSRPTPKTPAPSGDTTTAYAWDFEQEDGDAGEGERSGKLTGEGLQQAQGFGGLGLAGAGRGGGGTGTGSIGGLGRLDTGGGKGGLAGKRGKKRKLKRLVKRDEAALGGDVDLPPATVLADQKAPAQERDARKVPPAWAARADKDARDEPALADPKPEPRKREARGMNGMRGNGDGWAARTEKPAAFLPRMAYFENTYLGRDAGYLEELRQLDRALPDAQPWTRARLPEQPFDAPGDAGLALSAHLSEVGIEQAQRVFLQVGLKGSERFGWRRPPLDVVLVVDAALRLGQPRAYAEAVDTLLAKLSPVDRLAVIHAGPAPHTALALSAVREARLQRADLLAPARGAARNGDLPVALAQAARVLHAGEQGARVPGTGTVVLLTRGGDDGLVARTAAAAHALTVGGAVTSVISTDDRAPWWKVAKAGHGNDHRGRRVAAALEAELTSLSKVIARLLRLNIRLGPNAHGVRILGSRILTQAEKTRVKAREEATDRQISKSLGVTADRGADDDGLQTVIPFFYGGDAHVVLVELWVDKPGAVADITLKYKDMVSLKNATARASVRLGAVPRAPGPAELLVRSNLQGFELSQALRQASERARRGDLGGARAALASVPAHRSADHALVDAFSDLLESGGPAPTLSRALALAARRRISPAPTVARR